MKSFWVTTYPPAPRKSETFSFATFEEMATDPKRPGGYWIQQAQLAVPQRTYTLCAEITDREISETVKVGIEDCIQRQMPFKVFIGMPSDTAPGELVKNLRYAKLHGIGLILINGGGGIEPHADPVALSLHGLRHFDPKEYRPFMREAIARAESTFRNGNPPKGCSEIYDQLERYSRQVCVKTQQKNFWSGNPSDWPSVADLETKPWALQLEALMEHYDHKLGKATCPDLKTALIARVLGITAHRNESGHLPKNVQQRDAELRTRFESAADLLRDLCNATKKLGIRY